MYFIIRKVSIKNFLLTLAVLLFLFSTIKPIFGLDKIGSEVLSLTILMIILWIFNVFHYALVAVLPLIVAPFLNIVTFKESLTAINNPIIPLVLGSMVLGVAFKQSGLDKRIAYILLCKFSNNVYSLAFAFMIFTAFFSMFINNTSTTLICLFIVSSIIKVFPALKKSKGILLIVIAYSSLIGGNATIIGSPASALTYSYMKNLDFFNNLNFFTWSAIAVPFALLLLAIFYLLVVVTIKYCKTNIDFKNSKNYFQGYLKQLGPITLPENLLIILLSTTVCLWILSPLLKLGIDDAYIAVVFAFLAFFIPKSFRKKEGFLVNFDNINEIPWFNFPLLIGGYLLSYLWQKSNLITDLMGSNMDYIVSLSPFVKAVIFLGIIMIITELTANSPVAALFLPIITGTMIGVHPLIVALLVTVGANSSMILPSSTPTMGLIYGECGLNRVQVVVMGLILKLLIILLFGVFYFYFPLRFIDSY